VPVVAISFLVLLIFYNMSGTVTGRLQELALSLSLKCLSFDFVGTSIDESSEEFGTIQVLITYSSTV
jgi:exportin-7